MRLVNVSDVCSDSAAASVSRHEAYKQTQLCCFFLLFSRSNPDFSLVSVLQVQVCALSPGPRHPVVSPPGCLLRRPLLSHPRPRPASVSERLVGTSVLVLDCTAAAFSLQPRAVFFVVLLGCCAARRRDSSLPVRSQEPVPRCSGGGLRFWTGSSFQREALQAIS